MSATTQNKEKKMTQHIIKGINDDTDTCSCCGKTDLKLVVWIAEIINGVEQDPAAVGTTCATRVMRGRGGKVSKKEQDKILTLARAVALAKKWLANGHDVATVASGITAHFGFQVDRRKTGQIMIANNNAAIVKIA